MVPEGAGNPAPGGAPELAEGVDLRAVLAGQGADGLFRVAASRQEGVYLLGMKSNLDSILSEPID